MAVTLAVLRNRVRVKLNELDSRRVSSGIIAIDGAIADAYIALASSLPAPRLYTASAFTIAANAQTFALPGSGAEYAGDVRIQLVSDASYLGKRSREEIEALRHGNTSTTGSGRPLLFSLYEESDQEVQGDCWPRSKDAEVCNLYASLTVTDLRDAASMDAASITFSRFGSTALVFHAASLLAGAMTDEDLALRRLNAGVIPLWQKQADKLLYEETMRRNQTEDAGRTQRWIS